MTPLTRAEFIRQREAIEQDRIALKNRMDALMLRCPHSWHYSPDPAGDVTDSGWHCSLCGDFRRRRPEGAE